MSEWPVLIPISVKRIAKFPLTLSLALPEREREPSNFRYGQFWRPFSLPHLLADAAT